jgi:hypothetical protein
MKQNITIPQFASAAIMSPAEISKILQIIGLDDYGGVNQFIDAMLDRQLKPLLQTRPQSLDQFIGQDLLFQLTQPACLQLLQAQNLDYVFSATSYGFPIQRAFHLTPSGRVAMCQPEHLYTRSQDLEESFHDAGQFYWGSISAWMEAKPIFSVNSSPLILPRYRVQDIDTPQDWLQAEKMFALLSSNIYA